jgi:DNA-binding NarL/FixJ family response regulator
MRLVEQHPGGVGYLLKEHVSDLAILTDPTIVSRLVSRARPASRLDELTDREREVLALMAESRSNKGISERLFLSPKTVEAHVKHIFTKLGVEESRDDHGRVLAVLAFLRS